VVDEHYYQKPEWFLSNNRRYDGYDRSKSKVYVGEYASWGNTLFNALAEAAYMTGLERNGDVVRMASYAPLLANLRHTSWNPDLIYFTNTSVAPTVNYYVQQLFAVNAGDIYYPGVISFQGAGAGVDTLVGARGKDVATDTLLAASCVKDSKSGDLILKIVNAGAREVLANVGLPKGSGYEGKGALYVLTGKPDEKNTLQDPEHVVPSTSVMTVGRSFTYRAPAYSLSVVRIKTRK